ncbi:uncharacterized protein A1O9_02431 [Exophiala aquamarina CBS 119918]|uniref:XPG-I domain-containing protein n=1 Tax=Exophiala aquamarina CBS 119918 TaxID=1182545 RepID=A0A072PLA9_9EURO|nr:uncharacterized protein A1O9_02431 [Exophiala aquamarina CBS 119918]KEF60869.1 hypothetical protein A1O9_02431 [Exophiala aquamarina CBS 119918]
MHVTTRKPKWIRRSLQHLDVNKQQEHYSRCMLSRQLILNWNIRAAQADGIMGIPGILKEIGKGERVALAKLAVEHFERSQRPYRIAIDAAIWNFQNQAGQGGKNPALRTLFYKLLKLLALPIQPVFVYDGKNKPLTKRAPGEAEAECAMLQRSGVVDAVMSQDVDAIMFGSTVTLRDWSKEATKHNKSPTHVNILDQRRIKDISGLDPDGMILVALLSGGDYDETGIPGFGPGLACEAARAGFGTDLLDLIRSRDVAGVAEWRERLQYELESNESGHFKTRHKTVRIPDRFPDERILGFYMTPAISSDDQVSELEKKWQAVWDSKIDMKGLRDYAADTFEWCYKPGAWKFVRVTAPALLANLLRRGLRNHITSAEQITERRRHFISDGIPELRVTVIPADVVGLDLDAEEDSPEYLASLADEDDEGVSAEARDALEKDNIPPGLAKPRNVSPWLPHNPEKMWIAEAIVTAGARHSVEEWNRSQMELEARPKKVPTRRSRRQNDPPHEKLAGGMPSGSIVHYMAASREPDRESRQATEASGSTTARTIRTRKAPPAPRTPTKARRQRQVFDSSPKMKDYFNSNKLGGQHEREQAMSKTVEKLSQELEDKFSINEVRDNLDGKHSRPSTSISSSSGDSQAVLGKPIKNLQRGRVNRSSFTSHNAAEAPGNPGTQGLEKAKDIHKGQVPDDAIIIGSSPVQKPSTPLKKSDVKVPPHDSGTIDNITPRGRCRTKRLARGPKADSTLAMGRSPQRARRPIDQFFAPYIAAAQQKISSSEYHHRHCDIIFFFAYLCNPTVKLARDLARNGVWVCCVISGCSNSVYIKFPAEYSRFDRKLNAHGSLTFQKSLFSKKLLLRVISTAAASMVAIALGFSTRTLAIVWP